MSLCRLWTQQVAYVAVDYAHRWVLIPLVTVRVCICKWTSSITLLNCVDTACHCSCFTCVSFVSVVSCVFQVFSVLLMFACVFVCLLPNGVIIALNDNNTTVVWTAKQRFWRLVSTDQASEFKHIMHCNGNSDKLGSLIVLVYKSPQYLADDWQHRRTSTTSIVLMSSLRSRLPGLLAILAKSIAIAIPILLAILWNSQLPLAAVTL